MDLVIFDVANKIISFVSEDEVVILYYVNKHLRNILTLAFASSRLLSHKLCYLKTAYKCEILNNELIRNFCRKAESGVVPIDFKDQWLTLMPWYDHPDKKAWFAFILEDPECVVRVSTNSGLVSIQL